MKASEARKIADKANINRTYDAELALIIERAAKSGRYYISFYCNTSDGKLAERNSGALQDAGFEVIKDRIVIRIEW